MDMFLPIARLTFAEVSRWTKSPLSMVSSLHGRETLEGASCSWVLLDLPSAQAAISFLDKVPASKLLYVKHSFYKSLQVEPRTRGAYYVFMIEGDTQDEVICTAILCHQFEI